MHNSNRNSVRLLIASISMFLLNAGLAACGGNGLGSDDGSFVSDGKSRGVFKSIQLAKDESFSGLLKDTEVAVLFDPVNRKFVGRLRNEATAAVCDVRAAILLDDAVTVNTTTSGVPFRLDGLTRDGRANFEFQVSDASFNAWTFQVETFGCSSAPSGTESGSGEGSGEHGGSGEGGSGEGPGEHGGSGEGSGEGGSGEGSEGSPPIPITEPYLGTFQNQNFEFAYDATTRAFRGTVENPTGLTICQSRTEIHASAGNRVIELGPTIPVDLAPGDIIKIVMSAPGHALDTYVLHPESSPCQ